MENRLNLNSDGLPMHHMRRIGKPATKDGVVSVMDFYRATYMIGRRAVQVDFYIDSKSHIQSASLSRCHARVVRQAGNQHKLYDDSLNGVFVNDIKIAGSCLLQEGDKITFGHPCGARLPAGSKSRQPDSDNQFMFEMCSCDKTDETPEKTSKETSGFKEPGLPSESTCSKMYHKLKRAARNTTQCFSPGDIRQLKKAWEDRQSGSSTSESSDAEDTSDMSNRQTNVKTSNVETEQSDDEQMDMETSSSIEGNGSSANADARGKEDGEIYSNECKTLAKTEVDDKSVGRILSDSSLLSLNSANIQNNVNENEQIEVDNSSDKKCLFDGREDLTSLEGTFNSIMKDLHDLRGNIEHDNTPSSQHVPVMPKKSPTKDVCIQTNQIGAGSDTGNINAQTFFSPTKEMAIQTSQTMFSEQMDASIAEYTPDVDFLSEDSEITVSELSESVQEKETQSSIDTDLQCKSVQEDRESEYARTSELPFSTSTDNIKDHCKQNVANTAEISAGINSDTIYGSRGPAEIPCIEPVTEDVNQEKTYADKGKFVTSESKSLTNGNTSYVDDKEMSCLTSGATYTGTKKKLVEETAEGKTLKLADFTQEEHKIECTLIEQKENKSIEVEMNSKETLNKEINECISIGYKKKEAEKDIMASKYSQNWVKGDISEAAYADGPSLFFSDSVAYDEDEDHETTGLELSNSTEFTDSESEKDISDSETDDHRHDDLEAEEENTSDFGQDSETLKSNQINVTGNSVEGDLIQEYDDTVSHIESECSILSENCMMDDPIDTEMLDASQTNQSDCKGEAVPVNKNVDLDESVNYEGSNDGIAIKETCTGGEITTGSKNGLNTCPGLNDCNRKRKLSNKIIDDTLAETQRKRHCSDDMNGILNDKDMIIESNKPSCDDNADDVEDNCNGNIEHKETQEEVSNNYHVPVSDETKCSSDRQSRLHKFKKGVKRFFKFWSKNSHKLNEKSRSDVGYTYIQDKAGNYNLLELQCPYKISVSTERLKDVPSENSDYQIHPQSGTDDNGMGEKTSIECMEQELLGTNDIGLEGKPNRICMEQGQSETNNEDLDLEASRICMEQDHSGTSHNGLEENASRICIEQDQSGLNDKVFEGKVSKVGMEQDQSGLSDKNLEEKVSRECIENDQSVMSDKALDENTRRECMEHDQNVTNNEDLDEKESRKYMYMEQDQRETNDKGLEEEVGVCTEQGQSDNRDYTFDDKSEESQKREIVDVSCENTEEKKQSLREDVCFFAVEGTQVTENLVENDKEVKTVTDDATIKHSKKSLEEVKVNSEDFSETIKNCKHLLKDENSSQQENVDSDADRVETSICQTDNEIDPDDIVQTNFLISAFNSNFQSTNSTNQTSQTTLPETCTKQNIIVSRSQSPIIAKQGYSNDSRNDVDSVNYSVKRLFDSSRIQDDVSSQLSCRFSDDDEDDILSIEIDFNHLDDSTDDFNEDSESEIDFKQNQQDIFEKVGSGDENESGNEQDSEHLEENAYLERNVYQNTKDERNKKGKMDDECGTNMDDNTSDPLENYINQDTEDDFGSEYTNTENVRKESARVDVDFDFCDSESDKETLEVTKMKITEKFSVGDEDMDRSKNNRVAKRKKESDTVDRSPKRKRNRAKLSEKLTKISFPEKETNASESPFKTPSFVLTRTQMFSEPSPDQFSCTQLMDNSQALDLDCLTATQVSRVTEQLEVKARDNSRPRASRNKAKDLLEKLRAKRRIKEESVADPALSDPSQSTSGSTEYIYSRTREQSRALATLEDVDKHVNSCRTVVYKLKSMLDSSTSLKGNPRVNTWKQDLAEIEKKFKFPKTVIALVGDTGSGKSCLMNAILDHRSVLPTSGIRACTAVVVEVVNNTTSSKFEADIEFLQKKEWMEELKVLLRDLTGRDGTVKNRQPDPTSDAFISYCKVKAVYGKIDQFEVLSRLTTVTHKLGSVKVIKSTNPEDFRQKVEKYIETQEPGTGGQYWPIVKHVRLRMPNCDVCSSGAALVDLPGVRDSNAARDRIAKEYLKNCTAVWVVSSIHRAIDDKTAKELLGENFRRQLLMDGQYGSIAFICTKTDVITPSEIIRTLDLERKTKFHEDQICEMESKKCEIETTVSKATAEMGKLRKKIKELKKEEQELLDTLGELKSLLDPEDLESSQSEEKEAIQEYEQELKEKEEELAEAEERMDDLNEKLDSSQKILELEKKQNFHRKVITAICAKARNEYARTEIRRDFKAGLKEMKRRAGMLNGDEEDYIFIEDDEDDDDDDDVGSSAENLRVFCCSSTEYQKMTNLLTDDGPPQVFSSLDETQIPALRHYVHEVTSIRRKQWLERLIRSVGRLVFDLQMYVCEGRDMKSRDGMFAKSTIDSELKKFDATLTQVFHKLSTDIDGVFDGKIRQKMEEGAANASSEANSICAKWSAPFIKDKKKDKRSGGLHVQTYGATVRNEGVYSSKTYGHVDFNEDLAEPVYRSMTIVWDRAFSGMLWKILEEVKSMILSKMKKFTSDLTPVLEQLGIKRIKMTKVSSVIQNSASDKLTEMVAYLKEIITNKQREISRIITPHIQSSLLSAYNSCEAESGKGMYARMKSIMSKEIDMKRYTMFDEATQQLMKHLVDLQTEIVQYVRQVSQSLIQDLRTAFEPLWEAPSNTNVMRSVFHQAITEVCASVQQIYEQAGIPQVGERALVPVSSSTASVSSTALLSASPGGSDQTVAGFSKEDSWQNFENTFQRKHVTQDGMVEQYGQIGVRVKTERLSQNSEADTVETVSRVQKLHIKQENQDEQQHLRAVDQSSVNYDCQTGAVKYNTLGENSARGHRGQSQCHLSRVPVKQHVTATAILNTVSGQNVSQQANMKSLVTGKIVKLPVASTCVPVTKSGPCNLLHSANQFDKDRLFPTAKQQAAAAVEVEPCSSLMCRPRNTPTLNLVDGKENVSANSEAGNKRKTISASQPYANMLSFTKGEKKLGGRANVTLSQKDTETRSTTPPVTIKTEPADRGTYGGVKDLGTKDVTDE